MFPMASQFVFEGENKFCAKIGVDNSRKFEIESILRSSSGDNCIQTSEFIARNSTSHQFAFDQVIIDNNLPRKFSVNIHNNNLIIPQEPHLRNKFWIKNIRIADDIPGANVILHFVEDKIELKAIKSIDSGEELMMWFSEEIISFMNIPFLVPGNIQGQMKYCCHHCCRVYENPNPLKLHLARNCDQLDENVIWKRLQAELLSRQQRKMMIHARNFELINPFHHHHNHHAIMPSSSSNHHHHHRLSAFQPVAQNNIACRTTPSPPIPIPNLSTLTQGSVSESALAAAAHLETIVSNMGTSKQGHLCIYCGKLYSRKYGLKIHIRTHTGFKPLKCKYCYRPFGDPSNLNKHIRLHTQSTDHHHHHLHTNSSSENQAAYRCHICSKNLLKRRDLIRHMQLSHSSASTNGSSNISENQSSGQEDSQMTLIYSPALSSPLSSTSNEDDEEAEVVD